MRRKLKQKKKKKKGLRTWPLKQKTKNLNATRIAIYTNIPQSWNCIVRFHFCIYLCHRIFKKVFFSKLSCPVWRTSLQKKKDKESPRYQKLFVYKILVERRKLTIKSVAKSQRKHSRSLTPLFERRDTSGHLLFAPEPGSEREEGNF